MSFSSETNRVSATGNGNTKTYSYTFKTPEESNLQVTVRNTEGEETTLALTTGYTVTGAGEPNGGSITLVNAADELDGNGDPVAPPQAWLTSGGNLKENYVLVIRRVLPLVQETDIRNQGDFYPEVHEDVFDRVIMIDQQQQDELDRSLKMPETVDPANFNATIPATIVGESNRVIGTNADGSGIEVGPTFDEIAAAQAYAQEAATSATAADASATLAGQHKDAAQTARTGAETALSSAQASAGSAATSASAAATSATNSAASALESENSALSARDSEDAAVAAQAAAAASASTATTQAGIATTKAGEASTSATNASGSATNAASSASSASGNATLASLWAAQFNGTVVNFTEYSAKEYAVGVPSAGSAKDWANKTGSAVAGGEFSAKKYAQDAAASATAAQTAINSAMFRDTVFITGNLTITDDHRGKLIAVDSSGGNVVITLPQISGLNLTTAFGVGIKKTSSDGNSVTINRAGTDTIDGATSKIISTPGAGATLYPDTDTSPDIWTSVEFGASAGNMVIDTFSGNGSTTGFTLSVSPGSKNNIDVYISGVYQQKANFSLSGSTLTFTEAPPTGTSNIEVRSGTTLSIGTPADASVTLSKLAAEVLAVLLPAGAAMPYFGGANDVPTGWLLSNGDTIGSASSGATARANADTLTLYTRLWNGIANTELPIQTSAGAASTRGTSAAADFSANKRLPLPDARNVFLRGANTSTRAIGGITYPAVTLGATTTDKMQGHLHGENIANSGVGGSFWTAATQNFTGSGTLNGLPNTTAPVSDGTNGTPRTGIETAPVNLGANYIIKY